MDDVALAHVEPAQRGRCEEQRVGSKCIEPIGGERHECRLDDARAEDVDADDAQRLVAPRDPRVDLDHGTRCSDAALPCQHRVQALVEARARSPHLEIGCAGKRLDALGELPDSAGVDQLHRKPESDAQRQREHRQRGAPAILRERTAQQRAGRRDGDPVTHRIAHGARRARARARGRRSLRPRANG